MLLADWEILNANILSPQFHTKNKMADGKESPSFGPSSYGYDVRLGPKYIRSSDPDLILAEKDYIVIHPQEFLLCETIEHFSMPDDVVGYVKDKSTYARKGIQAFNTVIEPSWCGVLTLEIVNHSDKDVLLQIRAGIVQIMFHKCETQCNKTYDGKYQNDMGVQAAK